MTKTLNKISIISDAIFDLVLGTLLCSIVIVPLFFIGLVMYCISVLLITELTNFSGLEFAASIFGIVVNLIVGTKCFESGCKFTRDFYKEIRKSYNQNIMKLNLIK